MTFGPGVLKGQRSVVEPGPWTYPIYKLFQNRLYNCHPCRQDRADCLLLIDTRDEMNRVIISSGNRQSLGIALIRLVSDQPLVPGVFSSFSSLFHSLLLTHFRDTQEILKFCFPSYFGITRRNILPFYHMHCFSTTLGELRYLWAFIF